MLKFPLNFLFYDLVHPDRYLKLEYQIYYL